jgi:two-component system cell cycle sensor histidine kinase/response regulator CckA
VEDITELRQTEQALAQAQKMEAIGQLAGGIAHDFNNLLAVITVFSELAGADLPADAQARADLREVQGAVERAQTLTRQLLAFSKKQVIQPRVLELNGVITNMETMLRRVIGEDIELETHLDPAAGMVRADAGQIDQILMNLAVNARDAMPEGGRLTMSTTFAPVDAAAASVVGVAPGAYVQLRVTDTGIGMDEATRARVFEPFFTTKGRQGTGLGLATVYAIVHQCGGQVTLESEPGHGATFTILLPAVREAADPVLARASEEAPRGTETLLLVEDDAAVRNASATVLRRLGYSILVARSGEEGLAMLTEHPGRIDLVLTDVVMPGLDGIQLVERLRSLRPGVKAILSSGYAGDVIARRGALPRDIPFLEKPFTASILGRMVREVLDTA